MLRRHLTLRRRVIAALGLVALLVSGAIGASAYGLTRATLVTQRERTAQRQAFLNARAVRSALQTDTEHPGDALARLQTSAGGLALLRVGSEWFSSSVAAGRSDAPSSVLTLVTADDAAVQRIRWNGAVVIAVGVPLRGTDGVYIEFVPMDEVTRTLSRVRTGLLIAVGVATVTASLVGWWLSGRMLGPVRKAAVAAREIKDGHLDRRLDVVEDPDLQPLALSFNDMVGSLQSRIEREARFAADVTHELRSPLARMDAALSVARRRVDQPVAIEALDALDAEVQRFQALIVDLLEIGRAEAGVAEAVMEEVDALDLVEHVLATRGMEGVHVELDGTGERMIPLDKRRIGQALANLIDNANNYAGGVVAVVVELGPTQVQFHVDDAGPGIPPHEREYVFGRFARGETSSGPGTGLGLALVAEHLRLHGGGAEVTESPAGGARFTLTVPRGRP